MSGERGRGTHESSRWLSRSKMVWWTLPSRTAFSVLAGTSAPRLNWLGRESDLLSRGLEGDEARYTFVDQHLSSFETSLAFRRQGQSLRIRNLLCMLPDQLPGAHYRSTYQLPSPSIDFMRSRQLTSIPKAPGYCSFNFPKILSPVLPNPSPPSLAMYIPTTFNPFPSAYLSTISKPSSVYGDKVVLTCCNGITSVTSTLDDAVVEEEVDVDDDGVEAGDKKRPVVVDDGCRAACRIGNAYACALRLYVVSELDMLYRGMMDEYKW